MVRTLYLLRVGKEPPQAMQPAREGAEPDLGGRRWRRQFLRVQLLDDVVGVRVAAEEHAAAGKEVRFLVSAQVRERIQVRKSFSLSCLFQTPTLWSGKNQCHLPVFKTTRH